MADTAHSPDRATMAALVKDYHQALYRYAFRLAGNAADAEDLTQQAFLVAQQKLGQVRTPEATRSWLFAVLRNAFLKQIRRRQPLAESKLEKFDVEAIPDRVPAEDEIDREQLQAAISELPEEFRLVLLMFYFEDCSYREIAEQLDLPAGTVMSRLSRAKGHLRAKLLAAEGSSVTDDERAATK